MSLDVDLDEVDPRQAEPVEGTQPDPLPPFALDGKRRKPVLGLDRRPAVVRCTLYHRQPELGFALPIGQRAVVHDEARKRPSQPLGEGGVRLEVVHHGLEPAQVPRPDTAVRTDVKGHRTRPDPVGEPPQLGFAVKPRCPGERRHRETR